MLSCNIVNYLIKRQNERYIIKCISNQFCNTIYLFNNLFVHRCVFLHFVIISMYNECLYYAHCLCGMSYLVKSECCAPIKEV